MAHKQDGNGRNQASFVTNIMTFFIIFVIVLLVVFSLVSVFNSENETSESTVPSDVSIPSDTVTEVSVITSAAVPVIPTTTVGTTYPPATLPTGTNKPWPTETATTVQTTTVQTTVATTTGTEKPVSPKPVPDNITEKEMSKIIEQRFLTIHPDSRPGKPLSALKNIVVHYVANPGTTADQNWRNFENNKPGTSAHFIIGLDGEIIQAIPLDEVAWAIGTKEGNYTSISIECCHPDETGKFTDATYNSLVRLVSYLCNKFNLGRNDVLRHYDYPRYTASGFLWHKQCPLYYANDNDPESHKRWEAFKQDLIIYNE